MALDIAERRDEVIREKVLGATDASLGRRERTPGELRDRFQSMTLHVAQRPRDAIVGRHRAEERVDLRELGARVGSRIRGRDRIEIDCVTELEQPEHTEASDAFSSEF